MQSDSYIKQHKIRSTAQNKALHLLCQQIADYCVEHGITTEVLVKDFEVYPTMETIKSMIRQAGVEKYGKTSTSELTTTELQKCYEETVARHIAQITGEYFPFPSQETTNEALKSLEQFL